MTQIPAAAQPAPAADPHEIPLGQILTVFWRGRWIILACTLLGAIAGYFYVEARGTVWRALSTVYVETQGSSLAPESLLFGIGATNYANTQAEVMKASEVLESALKQFATYFPQPKLFEPNTNRPVWLRKALSIKVGRDDDIITVSLDSPHKEEACEIVNYVVQYYKEFLKKNQTKSATGLLKQLEEERDKYLGDYDAANTEVAEYRKANPGVGADSGVLSVLQESWRSAMLDLGKAESECRELEQSWKRAKNLQAEPKMLRQILPSLAGQGSGINATYPPDIQAMTAQILQLQRERADLLVPLQPDHPRVKAIDDAITELRAAMKEQDEQFATAIVASLEQSYLAAKGTRDALQNVVAKKQVELNQLDAKDTEYRKLVSKVTRTNQSLTSAFERIQAINVDPNTDAELTAVSVLQAADPNTAEVASGKSMRLAAAILLGLFAGAGLAWLRGLMDQRIRNAEEIRTALQVPILAILPRTAKKDKADKQTAVARWEASTHFAEAARSLRTAVYFGMAESEGKVVQVTSPESSDGKTTIAANLAIAMAKAGQRTLLVDADMRKPQQARQFGLENDLGLATLLGGDNNRKFASVVQKTDIPELQVMTSGPVPSNPAEMLNSEKFEKLLAELSENYDRIIVDSPPVLPVADARIISTKCSCTILTVRVDKSTRKRASTARDMLDGVGAKILGVALNDMPHGIGYGYGGGYGYYGRYSGYGYGYARSEANARGSGDNGDNVSEAPVRVRRRRAGRGV